MPPILLGLPFSAQSPLLGVSAFFTHCSARFRHMGFESDFRSELERHEAGFLIRPVAEVEGVRLYSSFQTIQLHLARFGEAPRCKRFDNVLTLMSKIQDVYLPLVRSDQRWGLLEDYRGAVAITGSYVKQSQAILLSSLRRMKADAIGTGRFDPPAIQRALGLEPHVIREWVDDLLFIGESLDPLENWRPLRHFVSYERRHALKYEALLAEDFYCVISILLFYLKDIGYQPADHELERWAYLGDLDSAWSSTYYRTRYGESVAKPTDLLEFLTNEFEVNPRPKAIILTEGEEWRAVREVFTFYEMDPDLLGIQFRSLGGEGKFKLERWQAFVEYMHENQTLVYFLLDREGHVPSEARKFLAKKRDFVIHGMRRVIPRRDRIRIWGSSFEEANFTAAEISRALVGQGCEISAQAVRDLRQAPNPRKKGLLTRIAELQSCRINKPRAALELTRQLLEERARHQVRRGRPIEQFVRRAGRLIVRNYRPVTASHQKANFDTGLLG